MKRIHLDTDLGGDIDDLCALALLLAWPEPVEITGITVVGDTDGRRTGMVRQALANAGRSEIRVAAGAETSGGFYSYDLGLPDESRYWPEPVVPSPNPASDAVALLKRSIDLGATIVGIGPLTNLRLLEDACPGALGSASYVQMGGYLFPPRDGYPAWTNADDFNVQVDAISAQRVLAAAGRTYPPLLVPLTVTVETALRWSHLDALRRGGPVARLIARQAEAFARDEGIGEKFGATCVNVPSDIINFQHDALAVALALGWRDGVTIEKIPLVFELTEGIVTARRDREGRVFQLVTAIHGPAFDAFWLETVTQDVRRDARSKRPT